MANIDDKVVSMSFESSKFEKGVSSTLSSLEKLKNALKFDGAGKGLDEVSKASKRVDFSHMSTALEDIKNRLGALRLVAISVFSQMAMSAIRSGMQFAKAFTTDPIKAGLAEYSTNLNAVQTILANTAASGAKLKDVNAALLELNKYSDKTIYNFSQMAKNIGTFTAAGVDLQTSTAAIKGIANLAALSGSNAEQAATAMYQLSQAIASGRVSLMDWNSVVNAGMGGTVFQRALAQTAEAMGTLKEGAVQLEGPMKNVKINGESFRESIGGPGPKWLTSDVLTNTLKQFTSDMSAAELKAQGFNDAQIKAIQAQATMAMKAATNVKTLGQVLDVAKETAGSGWAQTWQIIFGDFGEAKTLFTGISNAVNGFINASANARNKVLSDWKALGGRTVLISALKTAFQALGAVLAPIKAAFRDIFPAQTGQTLYDLTVKFKAFAESMRPSPETVENLRRTFRGLFAVLDIGKQIVSGIFSMFGQLFRAVGGGSGGFLRITAAIGDFLTRLDLALKKGNVFQQFFVKMGAIIAIPIQMLQQLGRAIANLFSGFSPGGFSGEMSSLAKSVKPFERALDAIVKVLQGLGPAISNAISNINWEVLLDVVRVGLLGGFVLMIKNFIGGSTLPQLFGIFGKSIGKSFGGGILGNISKAFGGLSGTLKTMQTELKARTLKEIAIAIALLAASVLALSLVDPEKLSGALGGMTIMFAELLGAMVAIDKLTSTGAIVKLPFIAGSLILLATAIDILTLSVLALSRLSWDNLSKGLIGIGALLGGLSAASMVFSKNSAGMIRSSIGIMGIAVALKVLASAVADLGNLDWTQLAKGLVGISGGLAAIALTMQIMPKGMVLKSASLIAIAAALEIIADAVTKFGSLNWSMIGKGLAGVGGSLVVIAGAMHLMPKSMVITAAGLLLVAASLDRIQNAVGEMGGMSISQIAKGLVGLGGALIILAGGLNAMSGTLLGAAALGMAAAGLSLLVTALTLMGKQSWGTILKGLIGLGAAIGVIAGASLLLSSSIPALLGFGAALVVIGAGLALAGAGIALIGVGLSAIAVSGTASIGILVSALTSLVQGLVDVAKDLVLGVLAITKTFAATAPQFVAALVKIIDSLLDVVIQSAPKLGKAFEALLLVAIDVLNNNAGKIVQAGFNLLLALLNGINNNIGQVVTAATNIIVNFLNSLSSNINRIVTAGVQLLASLIQGIVSNMASIPIAVLQIMTSFLNGIASNLTKVITAGLNIVASLLKGIASKIGEVITAGTNLIVNLITGIGNATERIVKAGVDAMIKFVNAVSKGAVKLIDAGFKAIINFMNGVADAINQNAPAMRQAGINIAGAIIDGMTGGLASKGKKVIQQAFDIGKSVISALGDAVKFWSPSHEAFDIGEGVVTGLALGLAAYTPATDAAVSMGNGIIKSLKNTFQITSPSKVMQEIGQYVAQGFAQGLRGGTDDIKNAFAELNKEIQDGLKKAREAKDSGAVATLTAAHDAFTKTLKDEKADLLALSNEYTNVSNKLKAAQDILATAIRTRDEARKSFTDQYSTLPSLKFTDAEGNPIDPATVVSTYLKDLQGQVAAVGAYNATLQQLRQLGLDDETYQKLLQEGTADQSFADQLLAGGRTAVEGLNILDQQLETASKTLGTNASKNLYQAGVDAARGVVNGLESKRDAIKSKMSAVAQDIINTLKKELKIKSPSQVMAEVGAYAMEGFARGFFKNVGIMRNAVADTVKETMDALKASMQKSINVSGINLNPVITPVLDLSKVKAQSRTLAALTDINSYAQASAISTQQMTTETEQPAIAAASTSITFEQNNYSPEALSDIEIYRQTKNQLSQIKSLLAV